MQICLLYLGVDYWKLLEMTFSIPPNTFWVVAKLHVFRRKHWMLLEMLGVELCHTGPQIILFPSFKL
jgi:hypothetical protein